MEHPNRRHRVSLFSAWTKPQHEIINDEHLNAVIADARQCQYGIVLTNPDSQPEPTEWNGPGMEDRRAYPNSEYE